MHPSRGENRKPIAKGKVVYKKNLQWAWFLQRLSPGSRPAIEVGDGLTRFQGPKQV